MRRNGKSRNKLLFIYVKIRSPMFVEVRTNTAAGSQIVKGRGSLNLAYFIRRQMYVKILLFCCCAFYRTSKLTPQIFEEVKQSHILASMFDRGHLVARVSKQSKVSEMCNRFQESQ